MDIKIEEKKNNFILSTLNEISALLTQVTEVRTSKNTYELSFENETTNNSFILKFNVSQAMARNGQVMISNRKSNDKSILMFRDIPILFLQKVALLSSQLLREITYQIHHLGSINLMIIDQLIALGSSIQSVFYDLNFIELNIAQYLAEQNDNIKIVMIYQNYELNIQLKEKNENEIELKNITDSKELRNIQKNINKSVKLLKYLRSIFASWKAN